MPDAGGEGQIVARIAQRHVLVGQVDDKGSTAHKGCDRGSPIIASCPSGPFVAHRVIGPLHLDLFGVPKFSGLQERTDEPAPVCLAVGESVAGMEPVVVHGHPRVAPRGSQIPLKVLKAPGTTTPGR